MKLEDKSKNKNFSFVDADDSLTSLQWLVQANMVDVLLRKQSTEDIKLSNPVETFPRYFSSNTKPSKAYVTQEPSPKPKYSYSSLITMAILSNKDSRMTLNEIYNWISDNFMYYKTAEKSWRNSIRHNLSLNKCFMRIPRPESFVKGAGSGKGGYWTYLPELDVRGSRKRYCNDHHDEIACDFKVESDTKRPRGNSYEQSLGRIPVITALPDDNEEREETNASPEGSYKTFFNAEPEILTADKFDKNNIKALATSLKESVYDADSISSRRPIPSISSLFSNFPSSSNNLWWDHQPAKSVTEVGDSFEHTSSSSYYSGLEYVTSYGHFSKTYDIENYDMHRTNSFHSGYYY